MADAINTQARASLTSMRRVSASAAGHATCHVCSWHPTTMRRAWSNSSSRCHCRSAVQYGATIEVTNHVSYTQVCRAGKVEMEPTCSSSSRCRCRSAVQYVTVRHQCSTRVMQKASVRVAAAAAQAATACLCAASAAKQPDMCKNGSYRPAWAWHFSKHLSSCLLRCTDSYCINASYCPQVQRAHEARTHTHPPDSSISLTSSSPIYSAGPICPVHHAPAVNKCNLTCRQALRRRCMKRRHAVRRHCWRRVIRRRQHGRQRRRQGGPGEGVAGAEQQPGQAAGGDGAREGVCGAGHH